MNNKWPSQLSELNQRDSVIITANQRMASFLRQQLDRLEETNGNQQWHSYDILPLTSWVLRFWQDCEDANLVPPLTILNSQQEAILWQRIVAESNYAEQLLQIANTAKQAQSAWQLLKQWCVDVNVIVEYPNEDCQAFVDWHQQFKQHCQSQQLCDIHSLVELILVICQRQTPPLPNRIILAGFDEIRPQYQKLFNLLHAKGCPYQHLTIQQPGVTCVRLSCQNTYTELITMASYAKNIVQQQNGISIGCVVPELTRMRNEVFSVFDEVFSGSYEEGPRLFNISAGLSLIDYPIIAASFNILDLLRRPMIAVLQIGGLLRSPFLAGAETEMYSRARLDASLQAIGEIQVSLTHLITFSEHFCPILNAHLKALQQQCLDIPKLVYPSDWAKFISFCLAAIGWPGERELNSTEYQLVQRWQTLLSEFASLDLILNRISFSRALIYLRSLATTTLFQSQTKNEPPIQILGALEAAGLQFDHLWIMGLHDGVWPPSPHPNPFIPIHIQKKLAMPHASAERELQFCQALTERFSQGADHIIFSHPAQEEDRPLRLSPLLQDFVETHVSDLTLAEFNSHAEVIYGTRAMESVLDEQAPALFAHEDTRGGTQIFKHQAACPFRAFALFRLGAIAPERIGPGLSALERGSLMHQIIEGCWQQLGDQRQLNHLTDKALTDLVQQQVERVLAQFVHRRATLANTRMLRLEQQRLSHLLLEWLALEKQRPPFKVIATEQRSQTTIAGLTINIQIDRIDESLDGDIFIIDYKTNKPSLSNWFGDRPDEPQLPIYCITSGRPIAGLAFAQINSEKMGFRGISKKEMGIKGVQTATKNRLTATSWSGQLQQWSASVERLAQQFQLGHAKVDPKYGAPSCKFCKIQILCRIGFVEEEENKN